MSQITRLPVSHRGTVPNGVPRRMSVPPSEFRRQAMRIVAERAGAAPPAMGHADTSITQRVYQHLFNREAAEDAFRKAMER